MLNSYSHLVPRLRLRAAVTPFPLRLNDIVLNSATRATLRLHCFYSDACTGDCEALTRSCRQSLTYIYCENYGQTEGHAKQ
jgi:hypothetical protein